MMDQILIDQYIIVNAKFFPEEKILYLKQRLKNIDERKFTLINSIRFEDPMIILIVSFFAGSLGIDRFMIGDIGIGIAKLLTLGGCGIWWLIDLFIIHRKTKDKNFKNLMDVI